MGSWPLVLTQPGPLRLYSTTELLRMPAPEWLIAPILPRGGLIGLYGPSGVGKSFIAIDMALSVASGIEWTPGRTTQPGFVVYISAEGGRGISKRVAAWLTSRHVRAITTQIAWLIESIPIYTDSEQMAVLINRIVDEVQTHPAFIVVDTMARCFDGDENQQMDMGRFIAGVDTLRQEFGCTVSVVHHTRLDGLRERGNTAFRGATDTMIAVSSANRTITLSCTKQKDNEPFDDIVFDLSSVEGTDSCVMSPSQDKVRKLETIEAIIGVLETLQPARWDDWVEATGLGLGQFMQHFGGLQKTKRVRKEGGLWVVNSAAQ